MRPWNIILLAAIGLASCNTAPEPRPLKPSVLKPSENGTSPVNISDMAINSYLSVFPNVSREEAKFRMGGDHALLIRQTFACAKEQEGYAGFVIRHIPEYAILSYFKGNAAEKLSICTDDNYFKAFNTKYSLADLEREKQIADDALNQAGIETFSHIRPFGHNVNFAPNQSHDMITEDGHVSIAIAEENLEQAKRILSTLSVPNVYLTSLKDIEIDEVLTGG